jgi:hypothetical protein
VESTASAYVVPADTCGWVVNGISFHAFLTKLLFVPDASSLDGAPELVEYKPTDSFVALTLVT